MTRLLIECAKVVWACTVDTFRRYRSEERAIKAIHSGAPDWWYESISKPKKARR